MTGLDTSVLIPLASAEHPQHLAATRLVRAEVQSAGAQIAVVPLVLAEFVHAVSDPKRFERPKSVTEAVGWLEHFVSLPEVVLLMPEPRAMFLWLEWMRTYRLGRKRTLDTQFAASLHVAGVRRLLTANPADFEVLGVFEVLAP